MFELENCSLKDFQNMRELRPDLALMADFHLVQTYEEFLHVLYQYIDEAIRFMEEDPSIRKDKLEDSLTSTITGYLRAKGYDASHDEKIGGHCDLVVKQLHKDFLWLGEAKIYNSYTKLMDGFNQLTTRYSQGTPDASAGGLLIYITEPQQNGADILSKWKTKLTNENLPRYKDRDCSTRPKLAFFSTHSHGRSGLLYTVRHMLVLLQFNPKK